MSPKKGTMDPLHSGKVYQVIQWITVWRFLSDEDCRKHFSKDRSDPNWEPDDAWKREAGRAYNVCFRDRVVYIGLINCEFKKMYKFLHGERIIYVTEGSWRSSKMYRIR